MEIDVIAFDADDTLWHNETLYADAQARYQELLAAYDGEHAVLDELYETEMANLPCFGYGIKSFALSMIETAIRLSGGEIPAGEIQGIINIAKEMKQAPVSLLEHVEDVIRALSGTHRLMLITKGDLLDQERKIAYSGLAPYFESVEVVTEKTADVYRALLARHRIAPERFVMVGNSLRSDVLPVVSLGARAVHIPYHITWAHETVSVHPDEAQRYLELEHIGLLPELVGRLERRGGDPYIE
ncbi:MAG: HAD hydrolase-like protein [Anaerolineae bacterium]|nr:HAD hydrolase-like protein [Anaerolineae bacterium]